MKNKNIEILDDLNSILKKTDYATTRRDAVFNIFKLDEKQDDKLAIRTNIYRQTFYDITLLTTANYTHNYGSNTKNITQSVLQIIPPRIPQQLLVETEQIKTTQGYVLHFKPEFLSLGFENHNFHKVFPFFSYFNDSCFMILTEDQLSSFENLFNTIWTVFKSNRSYKLKIIEGYLWSLLYQIKEFREENQYNNSSYATENDLIVSRYESYLASNFDATLKVSDYADLLCITPKHLSAVLKSSTGFSAKKLRDLALIRESKALMAMTDLSISEIAFRLQFKDASNFTSFYKRNTGHSPKYFRLKLKNLP